jgi:hypothetical protein
MTLILKFHEQLFPKRDMIMNQEIRGKSNSGRGFAKIAAVGVAGAAAIAAIACSESPMPASDEAKTEAKGHAQGVIDCGSRKTIN